MEQAEYAKMYDVEDTYWWFVGRRQLATTLIERWIPRGPLGLILDVGCGTGGNLASLSNRGRGIGIDLSPFALDLARRRKLSGLARASGLALPYPDSTFSLVTVFDVLYHRWITDDEQVTRECLRVLCPGGWLLITDSALPGLWSRHDEIYYARQRYTLDEIHQKLRRVGFRVRKISYTNAVLLPVAMAVRFLAHWFHPAHDLELQPLPTWLNRVLIRILKLEAMWLRWGTFPIGSSLICLAQKPEDES